MSGYIPSKEAELVVFSDRFTTGAVALKDVLRLSDAELQALQQANSQWDEDFTADVAAKDAAKAATQTKQLSKAQITDVIRSLSRRIQADDSVPDSARAEIGLPVHKTTRTPVAVPTTAPLARIEVIGPLQHRIVFQSDTHRGKPEGVIGCRIMVAIGEKAPVDPNDYRFVTQTGRSPHAITFEPADGCKLAHYILQWVNSREEVGPMSSPVTATIPAL